VQKINKVFASSFIISPIIHSASLINPLLAPCGFLQFI
jgi:hypothetical protein